MFTSRETFSKLERTKGRGLADSEKEVIKEVLSERHSARDVRAQLSAEGQRVFYGVFGAEVLRRDPSRTRRDEAERALEGRSASEKPWFVAPWSKRRGTEVLQ
jgi:hypothetical protein